MSKSGKTLVILLILVVASASVYYFLFMNKVPETAKYIPNDAAIVVSINPVQLAEKADIQKVRKMNFVQNLMKEMGKDDDETRSMIEKAMDHPEITGIDFLCNVYFYIENSNNLINSPNFGYVFKLKDKSSFENFLKKVTQKEQKNITDRGSYAYMNFDEEAILAWNEDIAIFRVKKGTDLVADAANQLTGMNTNSSIASSEHFRSFAKTSHDIGLYINGEHYFGMLKSLVENTANNNPYQSGSNSLLNDSFRHDMLNALDKYSKGVYLNAYLNFKNDRIEFTEDMNYDDNPDLKAYMTAASDKKHNAEMLNFLSPGGIIFGEEASANFKPAADFIFNYKPIKNILDSAQQKTGINIRKLVNSLSGDIAFTITDIKPMVKRKKIIDYSALQNYYSNPSVMNGNFSPPSMNSLPFNYRMDTVLQPVMILTIGANDKKPADSLLSAKAISHTGYYTFMAPEDNNIYIVPDKPGFTITNDSETAMVLVNKGSFSNDLKSTAKENLVGHSFGIYADLNPEDLPEKSKTEIIKRIQLKGFNRINEMLSIFKDIQGHGDGNKGTIEITMRNTDHNSLYTILKHIDDQTSK